ncbi:MAG: HesA/MoeB/ThiF family protein [Promethearchaeia archaeon]
MTSLNLDYFKRQKEIPWFKQEVIEKKSVAILGVGGIGCNIALLLVRLGIKKLFLIDYDIIEPSNLNRQTLYSKTDIGKKKVIIAKDTLNRLDNLNTEIEVFDYDIFKDWKKTIDIVKKSNYILNALDLPEVKRSLIGILCLKLKKPMIYAGTDPNSGYSGMILFQQSSNDKPCYECLQAILDSLDKKLIEGYSLKNILNFEKIDWLKLEKPDFKMPTSGATTIVTAMFASVLACNLLIQDLHGFDVPNRIIFDLFSNSIEQYHLEKRENCVICS